VRSTFEGLSGKTLSILIGGGGGNSSDNVNIGGLNETGQMSLGGGKTEIKDGLNVLVVAGGGGSGGHYGNGALDKQLGNLLIDQTDVTSGAAGTGYRNGKPGVNGLGGTTGTSFSMDPKAVIETGRSVQRQKYWADSFNSGSSLEVLAGAGFAVIIINF
jgi:hypothetical protein